MKYSEEVLIAAPRDEVIARYDNYDNLPKWQESYVSHEHLEGEPGATGSRTRVRHQMGKSEEDLIETIEARAFPDRQVTVYECGPVWNRNVSTFDAIDGMQTRWTMEVEFRASGLMMKVMMFLMPGAFKKQTRKAMTQFKAYVENDYAGQGHADTDDNDGDGDGGN